MKRYLLLILLCATPLCAQNPDAAKYSPRAVVLIDATPGVESVMPMVFIENGQSRIEYIPASKIKESIENGGKPIRLGDILALLGQQNQKIDQLQAENAKLWQAVTNGTPRTQTVFVQQAPPAPPPAPSQAEIAEREQEEANARRQQALQTWLTLQNANRTQTINLNYRNCTRFPALCVGR